MHPEHSALTVERKAQDGMILTKLCKDLHEHGGKLFADGRSICKVVLLNLQFNALKLKAIFFNMQGLLGTGRPVAAGGMPKRIDRLARSRAPSRRWRLALGGAGC
jgi:hypothetical protein